MPKSNTEFWSAKLSGNVVRDKENGSKLKKSGWKVFVVWECDIRRNLDDTTSSIVKYFKSCEAKFNER